MVDVEALNWQLFGLTVFFQKQCLAMSTTNPLLKQSQDAQVFKQQIIATNLTLNKQEYRLHMRELNKIILANPKFDAPPKQTLFEKKLQEKIRKVEKMRTVYGFSMHAACKEAKVARETAKKWLKKKKGNLGEIVVKLPKMQLSAR